MAETKKGDNGAKKSEARFTKQQFLSSERFSGARDMVEALLEDKEYTVSEVENKINDYKKGKVK